MFAEENDLELKPEDSVAPSDDLPADVDSDNEELPGDAGKEGAADIVEPGAETESEPTVELLPE